MTEQNKAHTDPEPLSTDPEFIPPEPQPRQEHETDPAADPDAPERSTPPSATTRRRSSG